MVMEYKYKTKGTCSREITLSLEDGVIKSVSFKGGCNGNLQGISKMAEGLSADEVIKKLGGIKCGFKATSCPDQLALALKQIKELEKA